MIGNLLNGDMYFPSAHLWWSSLFKTLFETTLKMFFLGGKSRWNQPLHFKENYFQISHRLKGAVHRLSSSILSAPCSGADLFTVKIKIENKWMGTKWRGGVCLSLVFFYWLLISYSFTNKGWQGNYLKLITRHLPPRIRYVFLDFSIRYELTTNICFSCLIDKKNSTILQLPWLNPENWVVLD